MRVRLGINSSIAPGEIQLLPTAYLSGQTLDATSGLALYAGGRVNFQHIERTVRALEHVYGAKVQAQTLHSAAADVPQGLGHTFGVHQCEGKSVSVVGVHGR